MARVHAEAERRHTSVDAVIEELAVSLPAKDRAAKPQGPSFVVKGAFSSGRRASEADDALNEGFGSDISS